MSRRASDVAPAPWARWTILGVVGALFAVPIVAMLEFTLRTRDGLTLDRWGALVDGLASGSRAYRALGEGIGVSLGLSVITAVLVVALLVPTMVLVRLRAPRLQRWLELVSILPISIPAIVLVVGLAPVYSAIARTVGSTPWPLALAYAIIAMPFAYRAIQADLRLVDVGTLTEAGRSLGAGFARTLVEIVVPSIRRGILTACILTVAIVLGEYTIAALLNRVVLQTALVQVQQSDAYASVIVSLLALGFAFVLLLGIAVAGSDPLRAVRVRAPKIRRRP
jgi:putative spermidine/putrescine transport system permease protein